MSVDERLCDDYYHPGTTRGCINVLIHTFECMVNHLVDKTIGEESALSTVGTCVDTRTPQNSLLDKINYLYGHAVWMIDENGNVVDFEIKPQINTEVHCVFHRLRTLRNNALHDATSMYKIINSFDDLVIETSERVIVEFKENFARMVVHDDNAQSMKPVVDFEVSQPSWFNIILHCRTRAEYLENYATVELPANVTHMLLIYYGRKRHALALTRRRFNKWKSAFYGEQRRNFRREMYFKFRISRLIERLQ